MQVSKGLLLFLVLSLSPFFTTQFTFEDSPRCEDPSTTCVLLSRCRDKDAHRNEICDFRRDVPLVCCKSAPTSPSRGTTPSPNRNPSTPRTPSTEASSSNKNLPLDCGRPKSMFFNRIVGGEIAKAEVWPWLVVLYIDGSADCGGSFISEKWILTAAHCVYVDGAGQRLLETRRMQVRLGSTNLTSTAVFHSVDRIVPHPNYGGSYDYANDVALLKLSQGVNFESTVQPICLPGRLGDAADPTQQNMTGRMAFIAGWGRTNQDARKGSDVLLQTQVPIWEQSECRAVFHRIFPLTNTSFCAGAKEGGKDACQGDSGGPMMLPGLNDAQNRFYAVGVISFGSGCGRPGFPGGYARTSLYHSWIEKQISE